DRDLPAPEGHGDALEHDRRDDQHADENGRAAFVGLRALAHERANPCWLGGASSSRGGLTDRLRRPQPALPGRWRWPPARAPPGWAPPAWAPPAWAPPGWAPLAPSAQGAVRPPPRPARPDGGRSCAGSNRRS